MTRKLGAVARFILYSVVALAAIVLLQYVVGFREADAIWKAYLVCFFLGVLILYVKEKRRKTPDVPAQHPESIA
jgi:hypothetical protein